MTEREAAINQPLIKQTDNKHRMEQWTEHTDQVQRHGAHGGRTSTTHHRPSSSLASRSSIAFLDSDLIGPCSGHISDPFNGLIVTSFKDLHESHM